MGNVPSGNGDDNNTPQESQQPQPQQQSQPEQNTGNTDVPTNTMTDEERHQAKMAKKAAKKAPKETKPQQNENGEDDLITFSAEDMKEQEDACASCERECEVLEYPAAITSKIDRDFVLHDSAKITRWNVLLTSGVSASKWPHDVYGADTFAGAADAATKEIEHIGKARVSVITRGPESGANPQEVVDLLFFPEFVKYCDVERHQLNDLFLYHTTVLAPRHQQKVKDGKIDEVVISEDQQKELDAIKDPESEKFVKHSPSSNLKLSEYYHEIDRVTNQAGVKFPYPQEMYENTFVTLCGHTLRDKRCGVTAPILREQFEIVLDQKHPENADKVAIDLVSHVGGHKVAGNCIIHGKGFGSVFYGRVFPEHVENIVDKTIMKGEILKPITRACHAESW